jgi:hypothetical protein
MPDPPAWHDVLPRPATYYYDTDLPGPMLADILIECAEKCSLTDPMYHA